MAFGVIERLSYGGKVFETFQIQRMCLPERPYQWRIEKQAGHLLPQKLECIVLLIDYLAKHGQN